MNNCKDETEDDGDYASDKGYPKIKSFRILGDGEDGLIEKNVFTIGEFVYLELIATDSMLDIIKICFEDRHSEIFTVPDQVYLDLPIQESIQQKYFINILGIVPGIGNWSTKCCLYDNKGYISNKITVNFNITL